MLENLPCHDPRSTDELISEALSATEVEKYWDIVGQLHLRGTFEVVDAAGRLAHSDCQFERVLAADTLAQIGVPYRTFPVECSSKLIEMLRGETNLDVLYSVLIALGHADCEKLATTAIIPFASHADGDIRYAVAYAIGIGADPAAAATLIALTADPVAKVRDWATFSLGSQDVKVSGEPVDSPEIRQALVARLDDEDRETRCEAMKGLARRGDRRMLAALRRELADPDADYMAYEALDAVENSILASEFEPMMLISSSAMKRSSNTPAGW